MLFRKRPTLHGITAAILCAELTTTSHAPPPQWWSDSGTRILDSTKAPDNRAVANLGQLKHVATKAMQHLDAQLNSVGGAGSAIHGVVDAFQLPASKHLHRSNCDHVVKTIARYPATK